MKQLILILSILILSSCVPNLDSGEYIITEITQFEASNNCKYLANWHNEKGQRQTFAQDIVFRSADCNIYVIKDTLRLKP